MEITVKMAIYTEPQKKRRTKKCNSHFSLHIVYMCNDKILVQR